MRRLIALASMLAACAPAIPVIAWDETSDAASNPMNPLPSWIDEGCAIVGLECFAPDDEPDSRGAVVLLVTPPAHSTHSGRELIDSPCRKAAWVVEGKPLTVAHELGHLFGLEHVNEPGNVMHRSSLLAGEDLTDRQAARLERRADRFGTWCP